MRVHGSSLSPHVSEQNVKVKWYRPTGCGTTPHEHVASAGGSHPPWAPRVIHGEADPRVETKRGCGPTHGRRGLVASTLLFYLFISSPKTPNFSHAQRFHPHRHPRPQTPRFSQRERERERGDSASGGREGEIETLARVCARRRRGCRRRRGSG